MKMTMTKLQLQRRHLNLIKLSGVEYIENTC